MPFLWKKKLHTQYEWLPSSEQSIQISAALYHFRYRWLISHLKCFVTPQKITCHIMHWASHLCLFSMLILFLWSVSLVGWAFYWRLGSLHLKVLSYLKQGCCCFLWANYVLEVDNSNHIFFLFVFLQGSECSRKKFNSVNHFYPQFKKCTAVFVLFKGRM